MPWLTPSDDPPTVARVVFVPDGLDWFAALDGLMLDLANPANWEQYGTLTPEETAERWKQAIREREEYENPNP